MEGQIQDQEEDDAKDGMGVEGDDSEDSPGSGGGNDASTNSEAEDEDMLSDVSDQVEEEDDFSQSIEPEVSALTFRFSAINQRFLVVLVQYKTRRLDFFESSEQSQCIPD